MVKAADALCPFHATGNEWYDCMCGPLSVARAEGVKAEVFYGAHGGWHDFACPRPRRPGWQCHCDVLREARSEARS